MRRNACARPRQLPQPSSGRPRDPGRARPLTNLVELKVQGLLHADDVVAVAVQEVKDHVTPQCPVVGPVARSAVANVEGAHGQRGRGRALISSSPSCDRLGQLERRRCQERRVVLQQRPQRSDRIPVEQTGVARGRGAAKGARKGHHSAVALGLDPGVLNVVDVERGERARGRTDCLGIPVRPRRLPMCGPRWSARGR